MRVFVTGGTGHVGSYIIPELTAAGHEVTALARSDTAAAALSALGATVRRGDLVNLDGLKEAAAESDGVIHVAHRQDLLPAGGIDAVAAAEVPIMHAYGEALAGTGKPLVAAGSIGSPGNLGRPVTEEDPALPAGDENAGTLRVRNVVEAAVLGLAEHGVRSSIVRIANIAHSTTDQAGFLMQLIALAKEKGVVGYPGDGANQWNAVHARDVASLFRLALENGPAGSNWHAVGDGAIQLREIAEAIGSRLGLPALSIPADVLMVPGYSASSPTSSRRPTRRPTSSPAGPSAENPRNRDYSPVWTTATTSRAIDERIAMTTVGIIGSGSVGITIARLAVEVGHRVVLSNSRGPETLACAVAKLGPRASAATSRQAAAAGDLVVVAVPVKSFPDLPAAPLAGKTVIDTCNYGPERDGHFPELDSNELTSSELLLRYLPDAMLVKAFHNIFYKHLLSLARPTEAADRSSLPIAGDSAQAKVVATEFINSIGYNAVDAGSLADSWRQETGTPVWGTPYGPYSNDAGQPADQKTIRAALADATR